MKLFVQTFGCQMNVADSGEMTRHFHRKGFGAAAKQEDADIVLLNTCTVRQHAEDKALSFLGRLRDWKKKDSSRIIIVAGCAAERLKDTLKRRFPYVDLVVGARSIEQFPDLVESLIRDSVPLAPTAVKPGRTSTSGFNWFNESSEAFDELAVSKTQDISNPHDFGFVTIMRGCNYTCSYCIVPAVRGRENYRPVDLIMDEVRQRVAEGKPNIMLLGQTVNSYWRKEKMENGGTRLIDFAVLLNLASKIEGVESLRFMSPHPHYMTDRLIETLGTCPKICNEIHMPVQSGSDRILKSMKRNYSRDEYVGISKKLRKSVENLHLSTDFIVGFPGETDDDFKQTLSLLDEVDFSIAYCFKYSPRRGTESAALPDDVPVAVKEERLAKLLEKVQKRKKAPRH